MLSVKFSRKNGDLMKKINILLVSFILIITSCTFFSNDQVAIVNGKDISSEELYKYIQREKYESLSTQEKKDVINKMCDDFLMRDYLEESGIFGSGDVFWEIRVWEIHELANLAFKKLVIHPVLNDNTIRDYYNKTKYDLNLSHILIGFDNSKNLNTRSRQEAEALVKNISKELNKNNFNELALQYSDDASVANNQGNLGWSKVGQWVEEFENAAYSLNPGQISDPIETEFGFHIIKLNERKENLVEPFEKAKIEIEEIAMSSWRQKFMKQEQQIIDSLETKNKIVLYDSTLTDFLERFDRLSTNVFFSDQFNAFDIMNIFSDSLVLGKIGNWDIDKAWIVDYLKQINLKQPPRFTDRASFDSFIEANRLGAMIYKSAIEMGLDKSTEFANTKNVYLAKKSSTLFERQYIYGAISPDEKQLKNFYEEVKDEKYHIEAKVQVKEVLLEDSLQAKEIIARIRNGEDISLLAEKYSKRNIGKKNKGLIPAFKKDQYGDMSIAAFDMRDGDVSGPYKVGEYYSVIQRVKYIPESYKTYDKIRYRILSDYKTYHLEEVRAEKINMLRNKYSVKINPKFINHEN